MEKLLRMPATVVNRRSGQSPVLLHISGELFNPLSARRWLQLTDLQTMQESQPVPRHLYKAFARPSQSSAATSPTLISSPPLGGNDNLLMPNRYVITRNLQSLRNHRQLRG